MSSIIKKENCVPSLRFPEFDTKWTFIKLFDVTTSFDYGLAYPSKKYDGKNKYIRITDIDEETNSYCKDDIVSPDGKLTKEYLVNANDILFARTGASTGKTYLYNHKDGILYFAGFLIRAHIKEEINSKFVFLNTQTLRYKKWVAITSMRSGQPGINSQEYANFKFYLPDKREQDKISDFITLIDNLIVKQIKYISTLETYNKGLISKIFKQEIRFKDDNGNNYPDWITQKIKNLFEITRGCVLSADNIKSNRDQIHLYPVYSSQTKNNGLMGYYDKFLYENAITWTTDGANAGTVNFRNGKFYCTNVCGVLLNENGYANKCIAEIIGCISKRYVSYVGNPKLMNNVMAEIPIKIPCLEEQEKIADFLTSLDNVLQEEKNYLEHLKTIKKGLLQQMFV